MGIQSIDPIIQGFEFGFNIIDKLNTLVTGARSIIEAPSMFDELEGLMDYVDQNCNRFASELYYELLKQQAEGMITDLAVTSAVSLIGVGVSYTGFGAVVGVPMFLAGNLFSWLVEKNRKNTVQEIRDMIIND